MTGRKRRGNEHMAEIIALWHEMDSPKPGLGNFAALCKDRGYQVSIVALKQWRHRGYLPGDLVATHPGQRKQGAAAVVAAVVRKAQGDVRAVEKEGGTFSKTMIREVCAKTLRCAEAFVDRITKEAVSIQINDAAELAIISNVAMQVMGKAAEVSESLQLLMVTEKNVEAEQRDGGPISLDERRASLAKKLGVAATG